MKNRVLLLALLATVGLVSLFASTDSTQGAFHLMRVYGVMGGAFGNTTIQYVELRQTDLGQNSVSSHDICFYDSSGVPVARFTFPSDASSGADGASILVGSGLFETAYSATRDFGFSGNTVTIPGGADTDSPVVPGSGKVAFGSDSATMASAMCQGSFTAVYDSVAYGPDYPTSDPSPPAPPYLANYPPKFDPALTTSGTDIIRLIAAVCYSPGAGCPETRENGPTAAGGGDYDIRDANTAGNEPRNNSGATGTLTEPTDTDSDGIPDSSDNCPTVANPGQENNVHPGTSAGDHCEDPDADSVMDITDNCPDDANAGQEDADTDTVGDACDNCPNDSNLDQMDSDGDDRGNVCDNCPATPNAGQENNVHPGTPEGDHCEDPDADSVMDIADNCPDVANGSQADADGDAAGDACDNCPNWPNPAQNLPPWGVPADDPDCDGFTSTAESTIGTDPFDNCPDNPSDDAWPSDIVVNGTVNIFDLNQMTPPTFGTTGTPGSHPTIFPRRDLVPSGTINIFDLNRVTPPYFGTTCS